MLFFKDTSEGLRSENHATSMLIAHRTIERYWWFDHLCECFELNGFVNSLHDRDKRILEWYLVTIEYKPRPNLVSKLWPRSAESPGTMYSQWNIPYMNLNWAGSSAPITLFTRGFLSCSKNRLSRIKSCLKAQFSLLNDGF